LNPVNKRYNRESGFLLAMGLMVLGYKMDWFYFFIGSVLFVFSIFIPSVFTPLSFILKGFSSFMSKWMSPVLLVILYFGLITPLGYIMRIFKSGQYDSSFRSTVKSYFATAGKQSSKVNLEDPF
jgi:hypothetical protein